MAWGNFCLGFHPTGIPKFFADMKFIATFKNVKDETITSVATGTVFKTIDGYTLQCFDFVSDVVVGDT